jgi:hypothetical protein
MTRLTREEARAALRKGQGRIVQHLREHGAEGLQDELLEACLHSLAYDAQCEGARADWLMSLIDLTDHTDFYGERILEALPQSTDIWDGAQLVGLALEFARRGCPRARAALYATFDRQQFREDWLGGEEIVALDGIAGMLHVAEVVGTRRLDDPEYWVNDSLLWQAHERSGKAPVMAALKEKAQSCAAVQAYLDGIASTRANYESSRVKGSASSRPSEHVDKILKDIESAAGQFPGHYTSFGKRASEQDLERVFEKLLQESRRDQLLRYLWVFRRRAPPRLHDQLFTLAASTDKDLQGAALAVLGTSQDRSIRDLGLRLLHDDPETVTRGVISLFWRNYAPGDHLVIEAALFASANDETIHCMGFDVLDLAESQPDPELARCLEWTCEHTPCSICRGKALKGLLERDRASVQLLEEAAWDCVNETRERARAALAKTE